MRGGHAEDGHDRITYEFLDGRTVGDQDFPRSREHARECRAEHFGVIRTGRSARIDDVREQDGHNLPFLRHAPSLGARW